MNWFRHNRDTTVNPRNHQCKGNKVGLYLPRLKGDFDLVWIGSFVEDGEYEILVGLVEFVSVPESAAAISLVLSIQFGSGRTSESPCFNREQWA